MNHGHLTEDQVKKLHQLDDIALRIDKALKTGKHLGGDVDKYQSILDQISKTINNNDRLGEKTYILYEIQALIHWIKDKPSKAEEFLLKAARVKGDDDLFTESANSLLNYFDETEGVLFIGKPQHTTNNEPPLQLQALIKGQRSSAIIMAILSVLSIYFIPWAIFYVVLASKLKPQQVPSRGLIKAAAIVTLPLCLAIIPIIIDIEFWNMNKKILEYEELGAKAFIPDKEYSAAEPKRKKSRVIAWSILLSILAILAILIIVAITTSSSSNQNSSNQTPTQLASQGAQGAKSSMTLPYEVDSVTTLTDITSNGNDIQYHYILHDADTSNLSDDTLRGSIQPSVCANDSTKNLLDHGVDMQYLYTVKDSNEQYSFTVTRSNC